MRVIKARLKRKWLLSLAYVQCLRHKLQIISTNIGKTVQIWNVVA